MADKSVRGDIQKAIAANTKDDETESGGWKYLAATGGAIAGATLGARAGARLSSVGRKARSLAGRSDRTLQRQVDLERQAQEIQRRKNDIGREIVRNRNNPDKKRNLSREYDDLEQQEQQLWRQARKAEGGHVGALERESDLYWKRTFGGIGAGGGAGGAGGYAGGDQLMRRKKK